MTDPAFPHVFISYAWEDESNPGHDARVVRLAKDLAAHCEVELDRWAIRAGASVITFMERMVRDPAITKVIVICDRRYTRKAEGGSGGVGTEVTIMTPDVYEQMQRSHRQGDTGNLKFIPVVFERDPDGRAYIPLMFRGAKYIDLSQEHEYEEKLEELLRELYGRPSQVRPQPKGLPAFMTEPVDDSAGPSGGSGRVDAALSQGDAVRAEQALREYLGLVVEHWQRVQRVVQHNSIDFELFSTELERLQPLHLDVSGLMERLSQQRVLGDEVLMRHFERFFEQALQARADLLAEPGSTIRYSDWTAGHLDLLIYEVYLSALAAALREQRWALAAQLTALQVFVRDDLKGSQDRLVASSRPGGQLFDELNRAQGTRLYSPAGDLLKKRASSERAFEQLCEAEAVLALRALVLEQGRFLRGATLPYWGQAVFETFRRTGRASTAQGLATVLGARDWAGFVQLYQGWVQAHESERVQLAFDHDIDLWTLFNVSRP